MQLSWLGRLQADTEFREKIDVKLGTTELVVRQTVEPVGDFPFYFDGAPRHTRTLTYHAWYSKGVVSTSP